MNTEIEKYDRAVYEYLATISPRITYSPISMAVRTMTKREQFSDAKPWNFISFFRDPVFEVDWERMNNPATLHGDVVQVTGIYDMKRTARYVHNIPVNLTYHVELWASRASEVQELAIDLITKIYMTDQVIEVPINPDGEKGRFHLLDVSWTDNSDLERETEIGKIYRHTISFEIDARITYVREVPTTRLLCNVPVDIYEN